MNFRSEGLSDPGWTNPPLRLPKALEEALERLSEALENPNTPTGVLLHRLWEAEDALTQSTLTNNTREED